MHEVTMEIKAPYRKKIGYDFINKLFSIVTRL